MNGKLFDVFARMAIQQPDVDICDLYNQLMQGARDEDVAFISSNFVMFLRVALCTRAAPEEIKIGILDAK